MSQRTFSYKQYRAADLIIFLVILCALDAVITSLAINRQDTTYFVSLFYALVAIVIMRWDGWAAIHCVAAAIVFCAVNAGNSQIEVNAAHWASYIVGNCCALLSLVFLRLVGKQKVRDSVWLTLVYIAILYSAVSLGRATMLAITKSLSFWDMLVTCFSTDVLSGVMAVVVVLIARRQNGIFEDQKHYLIRTEEQRREELKNKPPEE